MTRKRKIAIKRLITRKHWEMTYLSVWDDIGRKKLWNEIGNLEDMLKQKDKDAEWFHFIDRMYKNNMDQYFDDLAYSDKCIQELNKK